MIFNGWLLLNCFGCLSDVVFVVVWLFNIVLWIGEDAAFGAPGLAISSKHAREENEFCEIEGHDVFSS